VAVAAQVALAVQAVKAAVGGQVAVAVVDNFTAHRRHTFALKSWALPLRNNFYF
jgi:hypothetical protein